MRTLINIFALILFFGSCAPQHHLDRFYKKGGKIDCNIDTILVVDTIIKDGDTSYVWRDSIVVRDSVHFVTKFETKYKYLELKQREKTIRDSIQYVTKVTIKKESKSGFKWYHIVLTSIIGVTVGFIISRFFK